MSASISHELNQPLAGTFVEEALHALALHLGGVDVTLAVGATPYNARPD
jgi:C4-dicarboxylate-specific signal transduction histidine kinase